MSDGVSDGESEDEEEKTGNDGADYSHANDQTCRSKAVFARSMKESKKNDPTYRR